MTEEIKLEELTKQFKDNRKRLKRIESERKLQVEVNKMHTDREDVRAILRACYSYIAYHRKM